VHERSDFDDRVHQAMETALRMLDAGGYPADIGAHLDMALCRLREHLGYPALGVDLDNGTSPGQLAT
jgi:hypothetical protein